MAAQADDALARQLRALRREYLADSTQRVTELRGLLARLAAGEHAVLLDLARAFHRLAGSGGSYGFPIVSTRSREGERLANRLGTDQAAVAEADLASFRGCIDAVGDAFAEALTTLDREPNG